MSGLIYIFQLLTGKEWGRITHAISKIVGIKTECCCVRVKMKPILQKLNGLKYQNALITEICRILLITWLSCPLRDDGSLQEEGQAAQRSSHCCTVHHPGAGPLHPLDVTLVLCSAALSLLPQVLSCRPWSLLSSKSLHPCVSNTTFQSYASCVLPRPSPPSVSPRVLDYVIFFILGIKSVLTWVRVFN